MDFNTIQSLQEAYNNVHESIVRGSGPSPSGSSTSDSPAAPAKPQLSQRAQAILSGNSPLSRDPRARGGFDPRFDKKPSTPSTSTSAPKPTSPTPQTSDSPKPSPQQKPGGGLLGSLDKFVRDTAGKVGETIGREKASKVPGANIPGLGDIIKGEGGRRGRNQGQQMYDKAKETIGGLLNQEYEVDGDIIDEAEGSYGKTPESTKRWNKATLSRMDKPASEYEKRGDKKKEVQKYSKHNQRTMSLDHDASRGPGKKSSRGSGGRLGLKMTQKDRDDARGMAEYGHTGYDPDWHGGPSAPGGKPKGKKAERQKKTGVSAESFDIFDVVLEYLVAEGYADTNKAALAIMANMSEEWRQSIVEAEVLSMRGGVPGSVKVKPVLSIPGTDIGIGPNKPVPGTFTTTTPGQKEKIKQGDTHIDTGAGGMKPREGAGPTGAERQRYNAELTRQGKHTATRMSQ